MLEKVGARITTVKTSAEAERELKENEYLMVLTDLDREGKATEGLEFVKRSVADKTHRWTIAYVRTDQWGLPRPPYLFGITNRPDHLIHYGCDVAERGRFCGLWVVSALASVGYLSVSGSRPVLFPKIAC